MVKTAEQRVERTVAKYDPQVNALRAKRMKTLASTNFLSVAEIEVFIESLNTYEDLPWGYRRHAMDIGIKADWEAGIRPTCHLRLQQVFSRCHINLKTNYDELAVPFSDVTDFSLPSYKEKSDNTLFAAFKAFNCPPNNAQPEIAISFVNHPLIMFFPIVSIAFARQTVKGVFLMPRIQAQLITARNVNSVISCVGALFDGQQLLPTPNCVATHGTSLNNVQPSVSISITRA